MNLTTDIIVGFPGETEAEWQQTLAFVEEIGFGHLHIFAYSPRPGTKAAALPDPVSRQVKRQRSEALHQLGERMKLETLKRHVGRSLPVLFERPGAQGQGGYTPNFLRVSLAQSAENSLENLILEVQFTGLSDDDQQLKGKVVDSGCLT